jgi:hypothetical protein
MKQKKDTTGTVISGIDVVATQTRNLTMLLVMLAGAKKLVLQ